MLAATREWSELARSLSFSNLLLCDLTYAKDSGKVYYLRFHSCAGHIMENGASTEVHMFSLMFTQVHMFSLELEAHTNCFKELVGVDLREAHAQLWLQGWNIVL